jgi:amidase
MIASLKTFIGSVAALYHHRARGPLSTRRHPALCTMATSSSPEPRREETQSCYIGDVRVSGASSGPLHGLTVVVKDSYNIAGHRTGNGNPKWLESHPAAQHTARAVVLLLDAGADVVGKTVMDELAYSLNGENFHYGTPWNPACPDRVPGGSSAGAAAAVAAGDADIGLGKMM